MSDAEIEARRKNEKFIEKVLTENECWYKFLRLPAKVANNLPDKNMRLFIYINGEKAKLLYLSKYKKICGLTKWYLKYNAIKGKKIKIRSIQGGCELLI